MSDVTPCKWPRSEQAHENEIKLEDEHVHFLEAGASRAVTTFEPAEDRVAMAIEASKMPFQEREDLVEEIFKRFIPVGEDDADKNHDGDGGSRASSSSNDTVTY